MTMPVEFVILIACHWAVAGEIWIRIGAIDTGGDRCGRRRLVIRLEVIDLRYINYNMQCTYRLRLCEFNPMVLGID